MDKKEARRDGQLIALSSLENRILDLLFTNHDKAVSRNAVLDCIWEATGNDVYDHTVTVYMKRIRAKLGEDVIKTVKGIVLIQMKLFKQYRPTEPVPGGKHEKEEI